MTHPSTTQGRQERRGPHTASALPGRSAAARARSLHRTRAATAELAAHRRRLLATSSGGGEEDPLSADGFCCGPSTTRAWRGSPMPLSLSVLILISPRSRPEPPILAPPEFGLADNRTAATEGTLPPPARRIARREGESPKPRIEGGEGEDLLSADALLLRVDPEGHRAGLARLAEAALAVGEKSDHNPLKAAATDSRPPALTVGHNGISATDGTQAPAAARPATDLRLASRPAAASPDEGGGAAPSTHTTLSWRGKDATQTQER